MAWGTYIQIEHFMTGPGEKGAHLELGLGGLQGLIMAPAQHRILDLGPDTLPSGRLHGHPQVDWLRALHARADQLAFNESDGNAQLYGTHRFQEFDMQRSGGGHPRRVSWRQGAKPSLLCRTTISLHATSAMDWLQDAQHGRSMECALLNGP